MKVQVKYDSVNITALTLEDCTELSKLAELIKSGKGININIRYDIPPVKTELVRIEKSS